MSLNEQQVDALAERGNESTGHTAATRPAAPIQVRDRRSRRTRIIDVYDTLTKTRSKIEQVRSGREPEFKKNTEVFKIVLKSVRHLGRLFSDGVQTYFFLTDARVLIPIDDDEPSLQLL